MVDKMQNYYGIAIRANVGNLETMKKAVIASSALSCGPDSWCRYQQDRNNYKRGPGLPLPIIGKVIDKKCLYVKRKKQQERGERCSG